MSKAYLNALAEEGTRQDLVQWLVKLDAERDALLAAAKMALGALDKLMGDTDLPNDDSDEMRACQVLSAAIAKATHPTPPGTPQSRER